MNAFLTFQMLYYAKPSRRSAEGHLAPAGNLDSRRSVAQVLVPVERRGLAGMLFTTTCRKPRMSPFLDTSPLIRLMAGVDSCAATEADYNLYNPSDLLSQHGGKFDSQA